VFSTVRSMSRASRRLESQLEWRTLPPEVWDFIMREFFGRFFRRSNAGLASRPMRIPKCVEDLVTFGDRRRHRDGGRTRWPRRTPDAL